MSWDTPAKRDGTLAGTGLPISYHMQMQICRHVSGSRIERQEPHVRPSLLGFLIRILIIFFLYNTFFGLNALVFLSVIRCFLIFIITEFCFFEIPWEGEGNQSLTNLISLFVLFLFLFLVVYAILQG